MNSHESKPFNLPDITGWNEPIPQKKLLRRQSALFDTGPTLRQTRGPRGIDPWQIDLFPKEPSQ